MKNIFSVMLMLFSSVVFANPLHEKASNMSEADRKVFFQKFMTKEDNCKQISKTDCPVA